MLLGHHESPWVIGRDRKFPQILTAIWTRLHRGTAYLTSYRGLQLPLKFLKGKKKNHQQVWWQHFHPFQNVTLDYFLPWIHKTQLLPYLCLLLSTETLSSHSQTRLCARHCKGLRPPHPQLKAYSLWVASCNVPTLASNNAGRIRLLIFCDSFKNQ